MGRRDTTGQAGATSAVRRLLLLALGGLLAVAATSAPVAATLRAPGQTEERIVVRGVDASAFPEVVVEVQIVGPDPGRGAFSLREDGRLVSIDRVLVADRSGDAAAMVIAIDHSGSMEGASIEQARLAAERFVERARPGDRIGLVKFDTEPTMLAEVGTPAEELISLIRGISPRHRTALWDAIAMSAGMLADDPLGERYIVAVSDVDADSYDNASLGTADDAVAAAQAAGASVLAIGIPQGPVDDRELRSVAERTAGLLLYAEDPSRLDHLFAQLQESVRVRYQLAYRSQAAGPAVSGQLTLGANRLEFAYDVPQPGDGADDAFVSLDDGGGFPVVLVVAGAALVAILAVVLIRHRSS
jgi:Mg-chelatase subunit ChlD